MTIRRFLKLTTTSSSMAMTILASAMAHAAVISLFILNAKYRPPEPMSFIEVELVANPIPDQISTAPVLSDTPGPAPASTPVVTAEPEMAPASQIPSEPEVIESITEPPLANEDAIAEPETEVVVPLPDRVPEPEPEQIVEVVIELKIDPAVETVIEIDINPVIESVVQPDVDSVIESVVDSVIESVVDPVIKPANEPFIEISQSLKPELESNPESRPQVRSQYQLASLVPIATATGEDSYPLNPEQTGGLIIAPDYRLGYLGNPKPKYPRRARKKGLEGQVILHVQVSAEGLVETLKVTTTSGHRVLDKAALKAVATWHFKPASLNGRNTSASLNIPITFKIEG